MVCQNSAWKKLFLNLRTRSHCQKWLACSSHVINRRYQKCHCCFPVDLCFNFVGFEQIHHHHYLNFVSFHTYRIGTWIIYNLSFVIIQKWLIVVYAYQLTDFDTLGFQFNDVKIGSFTLVRIDFFVSIALEISY